MNGQSKWLYVLALFIVMCGTYLAFSVKTSIQKENHVVIKTSVEKQLNKISHDVVNGIAQYQYGLRGLRSAIEAISFEHFTYERQLAYFNSRDYALEFPGTKGFGLIKKVKQSELSEFLISAAKDRKGPFELKQLDTPQDPLFIIQYIEPEASNNGALGLDIGSESNRRVAALKSAILGQPQLTGPITLVQANEKTQHGFLLLLPIYAQSGSEIYQEVQGWVYAPLLITDILNAVSNINESFSIGIADVTSIEEIHFYSHVTQESEQVLDFQAKGSSEVFGRHWLITITPSIQYINSLTLKNAQFTFWLILATTGLLAIIVFFITVLLYQQLQKLKHQAAFANVVNNAADCIIGVDSNFAILHWNEAANELFDFVNRQATNQALIHWLSAGIAVDKLITYFKKVARGESVRNIHFEYQHNVTKNVRQLTINISPIYQKGKFWGATININDITEINQLQRNAERHNIDLEEKIRDATEQISKQVNFQKRVLDSDNSAIIACDMSGVISLFNDSAASLLGYFSNDIIGKLNIINVLDKQNISAEVNTDQLPVNFLEPLITHKHKQASVICSLQRKSGEKVKVSLVATTLEDHHGQLIGYVFIANDLSEKIYLESNMKLISAAIDSSQDILLWINANQEVHKANPRAVSLSGHSDYSLQHIHINDLIDFNPGSSWDSISAEILHNNRHTFEATFKNTQNTILPILVSGCITDFDDQQFIYLAAKDISQRLDKEKQLETALAKADVASKAKTDFIANMSHELRTPLNAANGFLQLLELTEVDELQQKHIAGTKIAISALTQTVDEILEITYAEQNHLTLEKVDFMLDEMLDEVGLLLYEAVGSKPLEIHFDIATDVPYVLHGDKNKLKRILLSLGGNAVKFSNEGEVLLSISLQSQQDNNLRLKVVVKDSGIGIEQSKLASIFNIFTQANNEANRQHGGLGIGLTIANQYVSFLGGQLEVASEVALGSVFTFDVIMQQAINTEHTELSFLSDRPISVLLVDDNQTSLSILGDMITFLGWKVTACDNADDALVMFQSALNHEEPFDLALIDWKMPQTDGWELAELIRKVAPVEQIPLLIMVTAHSKQMFAQNSSQAPHLLNGFLTKPVTRAQMISAFYDAVASAKLPLQRSLKSIDKPLLKLRILIVEDNPTNQNIAKALLESQGANIVISSGGKEALFELENGLLPFDVVLMDIQMPDIDGYETTKRIRAIDKFSQLPIIAMTANVMSSDKEKCKAAGMNGHIGKPFELAQVVKQVLSTLNEFADKTINHEPEEEKMDVQSDNVLAFCDKADINLAEALARFNNMEVIYLKSLGLFTSDLQKYVNQLDDVSSTPDDLKLIFHTLKSTAGALGFTQLTELAKEKDQTLANLNIEDFNINDYQPFSRVLAANLASVNELILLLQNKPQTQSSPPAKAVDFALTYQQLKTEIDSFNMHAIDTFQLITSPLKSLSTELADELITALNRLKFKDAKEILTKLDEIILEKTEHASK
ncbi:response regulator [Paraglaciecola sp.]|uniref:response regulator n=1 Tax=Paraglaciecola sp. TaxID=1920173 RepID=UPI0030F44B4A